MDLIWVSLHLAFEIDIGRPSRAFPVTQPGKSQPESQTKSIENTEIAFLKDIQEYPDSGIAARYKRLGLSVRHGQKVKAKLLEDGLIEEKREVTKTGRLTSICLTKEGERSFAKPR